MYIELIIQFENNLPQFIIFTQTFSPENGDSNGTVNTSFIANGEKDIEKNGNEVERESDGEDQRGSTAGNVYI